MMPRNFASGLASEAAFQRVMLSPLISRTPRSRRLIRRRSSGRNYRLSPVFPNPGSGLCRGEIGGWLVVLLGGEGAAQRTPANSESLI
jgi:hypothetical protein